VETTFQASNRYTYLTALIPATGDLDLKFILDVSLCPIIACSGLRKKYMVPLRQILIHMMNGRLNEGKGWCCHLKLSRRD
jgi:hypothetical protein